MVKRINGEPTLIKEHIQLPLTYKENMLLLLEHEKHGTVVWQHTDRVHVVGMYIERGKGFRYSRSGIDLYNRLEGKHIDMRNMASVEEAFEKAWKKSNPSPNAQLAGMFPRVTTSVTNNERKKLESYIVADGELGENELSDLPSTRSGNRQDRTHLIPLSVTGVENHRALLIMFDSYLNQHNLKDFEERNIDRTKTEDIIWWVVITRDEVGHLDWYYNILDRNGNLIEHLHVKDDRWYYKWYYDSSYQELGW